MDDLFDFGNDHDPGGKVKIPVSSNIKSDAVFSPCGQARFVLTRQWCFEEPVKTIMWIGMNPSIADMFVDDPTVKKEIGFSQRWGFGKYVKTNVTPYRSTDPKNICFKAVNQFAYENLVMILNWAREVDCVVACWGNNTKLVEWANQVYQALLIQKTQIYCLGVNGNGSPKHPLYLKNESKLIKYER